MNIKLAIVGIVFLLAPGVFAQNLLINPSFETGDFTGWTHTDPAAIASDGTPLPGAPTHIIHSRTGTFALSGYGGPNLQQNVNTIPGQNYIAGFYASEGTAAQSVTPSISIGSISHVQILTIPGSPTPAFAAIRQFYTAPSGAPTSTLVSFSPGGASTSYDDFFIQPYTPPPVTSGQTARLILSGDPVPDHPGAVWGGGNIIPYINNSGATLENIPTTLGAALAISDGKSAKAVVIKGQSAPEGNGLLFPSSSLSLNNAGQFAFGASLTNTAGGTADDFGVYLYNGSSVVNVAREGTPVPDGNGSVTNIFSLLLNEQGKVIFRANLTGTAGGSADNNAIFLHDGSQLIKLARTGDPTPSGAAKFDGLGSNDFGAINAAGQVAFTASSHPNAGGNSSNALYLYNNSVLTELARTGQTLDNQAWSNPGHVAITDSGKIIVDAKIGSTTGILLRDNNTYKVLAQLTKPDPDGNGTFSAFSESATASNNAQIAFRATLTGTAGGATDNSGIYRAGPEGIVKIARAGQLTPENDGNFSVFDPNPSINSTGIVAFVSQNSNANNDSEVGIYVGDGRDTLMVTRFGYGVDGAIIDTASVINRVPTSINSFGQVAYRRVMSDGLTRILRWTPTLHWRSNSSGDWNNADNWTLGLNPAAPHPVVIDPASATTVNGPTGTTPIQSLEIGGTAPTRLALAPASNLTVTADAKLNPTATLTVHVAGTQFDDASHQYSRLTIGGNASLSGVLDIALAQDFHPQLGDSFDILTYATHTGHFDSISHVQIAGNRSLAAIYLNDRLRLTAALPGDANLDQSVSFADLVAVAQHYGSSDQTWSTGDFTGDGMVNFQDLVIVAQNYGTGIPLQPVPSATPDFNRDLAAASVPEPSILGTLLVLASAQLRRRRAR